LNAARGKNYGQGPIGRFTLDLKTTAKFEKRRYVQTLSVPSQLRPQDRGVSSIDGQDRGAYPSRLFAQVCSNKH